jgi:uncharacterized repeat protein (TIGR03803 family)
VVFELAPTENGWSETVLYSFAGGNDGAYPYAGLALDPEGSLFGTRNGGGASGVGTVYRLRYSNGQWTEHVIHTFDFTTGNGPLGGLVFDRRGDLFGTTQGGGASGAGVVFGLQRSKGNTWTARVLHSFTGGTDGAFPYAERLIFDRTGNLYGTTEGGGSNNYGIVFRLSPISHGWKEQVLHEFTGAVEANPYTGLVMDGSGNLYGTCANGDGVTTVGSVFELTPAAGGNYAETDLHQFTRADGEFPEAALLLDKAGNLYGTTLLGGAGNIGVVFEVSK